VGRPILVGVVHRMTGREMLVRIEPLDQFAGRARPSFVAILVEVVTKVPGDVGKGAEARDSVAEKLSFQGAARGGMNLGVVHVQDEREHHVAIAREAKSAVKFLPVREIEAAVVETGMVDIVWLSEFAQSIKHAAANLERQTLTDTADDVKDALT